MSSSKKVVRSLLVAFMFFFSSWASASELFCKYVVPISEGYLGQHVLYDKSHRNLEVRTVEQFIKKLDLSKIYLLQSDVDAIKKNLDQVFKKVRGNDCSGLVKAQEVLTKRVKERVEFAKNYLGSEFKFDTTTEVMLDPDKRSFPKSIEEANNFHKKYLQFQISNYLATDMSLKDAKAQVLKSYDRIYKRVADTKEEDVYANYLDAYARSLDPHSSFFSRDVQEDFEIGMKLSLEGIGATLTQQDGFTVIDQLIPGGAAARSGLLKPKDKITAVGQGENGAFDDVIDMDLRDVVKKIRGPKNTKVRLVIMRKAEKKTFTVTLVRDQIKLEEEAANINYFDREINGRKLKIGLINLPSFYADSRRGGVSSAADVKKLLKDAKAKKVDAVVLDLSMNGGGSLEDAVKISGLFFKTGNVVKQSSRDPLRPEAELRDEDSEVDYSGPLVVLTSRVSASASEIVAGTLKDYKRAVVVGGDHTFGKGSVQSVIPLPKELGALKVTVGMFFTPGGNSTQHRGVDADIVLPSLYSTDEIGEKTLDYSLPPKTIKPFLSEDAYVRSGPDAWRQVDKSTIDVIKGLSTARVAKNEEFQKILKDLKKNDGKSKMLKLADVMKEKEESSKDKKKKKDEDGEEVALTREEKKEEYLKRPDVQEAINVALDLVSTLNPVTVRMANESAKNPEKSPN